MLEVNVTGLKELDAALGTLPEKMQRNVLRAALRAGAKEIADEAKRLAPVKSGRLRDSIRVTSRIRYGTPTATVVAGGRGKGKNKGAWYAHFIEYGTAAHVVKAPDGGFLNFLGIRVREVNHPGARKKPFMRPAADTKSGIALDRFAAFVRARLTKQGIEIPDPEPETD